MKTVAALVSILAMTQGAIAQTDCRSIAEPGPRLACYDRATPPTVSAAPSVAPTTSTPLITRPLSATKVDQTKYVDTIGAEDALMNARLKNICRGC